MRWWRLPIIIAALATAAVGNEDRPSVRITLRDKAEIADATVRLGDIAEVTALCETGAKHLATLRALPIAPAPLPRYRRVITAGEVATKLAQAGWRDGDCLLDGANQVLVVRSGRAVTASELEAALQKALNTPVKLLLPLPPVIVPDGALTVQTETHPSPRAVLPVTVLVNGRPVATLRLLVQVTEKANGQAVASRPASFAVRRRQTVRLVARVGSVVVEAQGTALQDGKLGDEVLVVVAWSRTPLKGLVSGEREVTVASW